MGRERRGKVEFTRYLSVLGSPVHIMAVIHVVYSWFDYQLSTISGYFDIYKDTVYTILFHIERCDILFQNLYYLVDITSFSISQWSTVVNNLSRQLYIGNDFCLPKLKWPYCRLEFEPFWWVQYNKRRQQEHVK